MKTVEPDNLYVSISIYGSNNKEFDVFAKVLAQGIDARLEGFTLSSRHWSGNRLHMMFHKSELQILIRRLVEQCNADADRWADDIVLVEYGYEYM